MSIMRNDKYYDKYLKYKSKYTELKQQTGGAYQDVTFFFTRSQYDKFIEVTWSSLISSKEKLYANAIRRYENDDYFSMRAWRITGDIAKNSDNTALKLVALVTTNKNLSNVVSRQAKTEISVDEYIQMPDNEDTRLPQLVKIFTTLKDIEASRDGGKSEPFEYAVVIFVSFVAGYNEIIHVYKYDYKEGKSINITTKLKQAAACSFTNYLSNPTNFN